MTDWGLYLACTGCHALMGEACFALSSGGPEALPPVHLDEPHRHRKLSTAKSGVATAKPQTRAAKSIAGPQRRRASRTANTAEAWRALAKGRR